MHFQRLNLNLLVSLDALLTEKSVTRAAERLHVTQPAMSASLQQLRQYLSDPLLEKVGRQLELTQRGRDLAMPVKELLLRIDTVLHTGENFDPPTAVRTFKVAMSAYMADLLGPPIAQQMIKEAPGTTLQIVDLSSDSFRAIEEGELDYCISVSQRAQKNPPDRPEILASRHLFSDSFVLVSAFENERVFEDITYEQFCKLPYIGLRFSGNLLSLPDVELERQAEHPRVNAWLSSSQNALAAVAVTEAVALVPTRLFMLYRKRLNLKSVQPPLKLPTIHQTCFYHSRNGLDAGHRWFGDILEAKSQFEYGFKRTQSADHPD